MSACIPDAISISKDPARKPSPCLASHTAMASFSELANLSADMVAKVEDSKEARPAMRPEYGAVRHGDGGDGSSAGHGGAGQVNDGRR